MTVQYKKVLAVLAFISVIFVVLEQWMEIGTVQTSYSTGSRQEFSVLTDANGLLRLSANRGGHETPLIRISEVDEDDTHRKEIENIVEDVEKSDNKGSLINKGGISGEDRDVQSIGEGKKKSEQFQIPTNTRTFSMFYDNDIEKSDDDEDRVETWPEFDDEEQGDSVEEINSSEVDASEKKKLRQSPYIYWPDMVERKLRTPVVQNQTKYLAYFLPFDIEFHEPRIFRPCRYDKCEFVNNMSNADVVMFRASLVKFHHIPSLHRPKGQRWLLFTFDPATRMFGLDRDDVGSNFNWTLTYQLSADLPYPFGSLVRRTLPAKDFETLYKNKSRLVAWFVSHCPTWGKREDYVSRMQKVIDVDIYGRCGKLSCPDREIHLREFDSTLCLPMLTNHYKFYLSFENSFCKDYVSEKFFKLFNDVDVIPVVRGGFDYQKYLPSNTFVDASEFESPEALAKYLRKLGDDKDKYIRMLKEKNKWTMAPKYNYLCTVCEALHTTNQTEHYHENLKHKFNGDPPECWQPTDL